jgi:hypothetical protein
MKTRTILLGLILLPPFFAIAISARAQTAKPAAPSHQQTADVAARKQLAAYLVDFKNNPEDATLRGEIIELAKTLKPAPLVPLAARAEYTKAAAQMKTSTTADDFKAAAKLFEQVTAQAPWYTDAYLNAASAYAKAADYDSAKRNLALYLAAVRPGVDTKKAEDLQSDMEQQEAAQQQQQALQQFQQALQQFQASPNDAARQQIIKLAQAMKTPPAIPEEAREHYAMAQEFAKKAKNDTDRAKNDSDLKLANDGFERAVAEYKAVLQAAPWWAIVYKELAMTQKAAQQYDDAIACLNLYLASSPADARDAQDEIYKLKADKQTAADQKAAEERRKWEEENSPQAVAAREQKKYDEWLRRLDGARYIHVWTTQWFIDNQIIDIHGNKAAFGSITTWASAAQQADPQTHINLGVFTQAADPYGRPIEGIITGRTFLGANGQHTISEDGNSITEVYSNGTVYVYYRQK